MYFITGNMIEENMKRHVTHPKLKHTEEETMKRK